MADNHPATRINKELELAFSQKQSIVLFRLPEQDVVHFYRGRIKALGNSFEEKHGFLIAPFQGDMMLLEPDSVLSYHQAEKLSTTGKLYKNKGPVGTYADEIRYRELVRKGITAIRSGDFQKVVLSRQASVELSINTFSLFHALCEKYPSAFVYLLSNPCLGTWMGSSPELLLNTKAGEIETMALAGTSSLPTEMDARNSFKEKETEEQGLVGRFIEEALTPLTEQLSASEQGLKKAGHLYHLYTQFKGKLKASISLWDVVKKLHPTPAVGGYPSMPAIDFILSEEGYNRELYSGFLGPLNKDSAELFVNLRCMQLTSSAAILYAGAGIVKGSIPEKEWEETEQKMQTLLQVIYGQ